jgi:CBS domain containing-hemolysin-like protein
MDSELIAAAPLLALGALAYLLVAAAEAGVVVGVRERAMKEPAESRMEALRHFYRERRLTLSALSLARNLAVVGVTAVSVFVVVEEVGHTWPALLLTVVVAVLVIMLLHGLSRVLVARNAEWWQRRLRPLVTVLRVALRPAVLVLDAPVEVLAQRLPGRRRNGNGETHAEEHILLAELEQAGAALQEEERQMIRGVMELEFRTLREVMVPRTDMVAVNARDGFEAIARVMVDEGYSRVPVYEDNIDNIIGIAYAKEVLKRLARGKKAPSVEEIIRPAYFVPESKKVHEMLAEMKQKQISIAVVVDEYGGTAGLVTIEDLLEEIVGELRDEFDIEERTVELVSPNEAVVDARVGIEEINEMFDVEIQRNGDFDSVGGLIINELGRLPNVGDTVAVNGIQMKVLSVSGRRVRKVRITKTEEHETPA